MVLDNGVFGASPGLRIRFLLMMWVSREDCSEPRYAVLGIGLTRDRICSVLPARTWPSAMLIITTMASPARAFIRCPPWRAKRRRVVPGSREATRDTRRAEGAKGDPKGASERGVQSYGRQVCSRNELAMLWRNAG